jgi:argininosuccinate synthase
MSDPRSPGQRIGLLISGGLSSLALAAWLHDQGHDVVAFAADIGPADTSAYREFTASVRAAGITVHEVDLLRLMAATALETVAFQARYDGGYWNTTGLSRAVLVEGLAPALRTAGCQILATGCVSGGNDQKRFERYTQYFAPDLTVLAPWGDAAIREALPDRDAMARYIARAGLYCLPGNSAEHSTEGNLAGVSHEDATLEDLGSRSSGIPRLLGVGPLEAPDTVASTVIEIEAGRPVSIDGVRLPPERLLAAANEIGGRHGLGLTDVVENRVNGTKCRGVYEAPGLELLFQAVRTAHQASTDRRTGDIAQFLAERFAASAYEGAAYGPAAQAARAGLERLIEGVTATVRLDLYKGQVLDRTLVRLGAGTGVVRQRRFGIGGQVWNSEPVGVGHA